MISCVSLQAVTSKQAGRVGGSMTRECKVIPGFTLIGDEWNQAVDVGNWIVKYDTLECIAFSDGEFKEKFKEEQ